MLENPVLVEVDRNAQGLGPLAHLTIDVETQRAQQGEVGGEV